MPSFITGSGKEVPFQDWAPDQDPTTPGILLDTQNAIPTMKGYLARNIPKQLQFSPSGGMPATPTGAYVALFSTGLSYLHAYAAGHFYRLGGSWTENDGSVVYPATSRVRFTQFNDDVIATANGFATPLVLPTALGTWAPLGGSPPANAVAAISVAGFVVFFAGSSWFSSAAGVDNNYVPDIQTLAATGTLYDVPGNITAAAALYRNIIAFKEGATWLGTFSGAPFTWSFQLISPQIGTYGQECVVPLPDSIAFLGTDDFYITTGYTPQRIPNSIKEWFFANADPTQLQNVIGWYDHLNAVIYWHFISLQTPVAGQFDRYVAFNVRVGRWATGYLNANFVVPNTQDSQSVLVSGQFGTAENGWFFDPSNNTFTWSNPRFTVPGTMYLKTGFMGDPSHLSQLLRFRVKHATAPTSDFAQAYHCYTLGGPLTFDAAVVKGQDDWFNLSETDRYHQVQYNSVGPCEVVGMTYEARMSGTR